MGLGLSYSGAINDLEAELESVEKRKDTLRSLLHSGRISQNTYDLMEKKTERLTALFADLKDMRREEESFWGSTYSEETRILELLLVEFKVRHLLGEIGEEEWRQKSQIIDSGLDAFKKPKPSAIPDNLKPAPPTSFVDEKISKEEVEADLGKEKIQEPSEVLPEKIKTPKTRTVRNKRSQSKPKRKIEDEQPKLESAVSSEGHCMNPWNTGCRNTDIELSIYYNGKLTPICHKCWEEISKKNIEWSGL